MPEFPHEIRPLDPEKSVVQHSVCTKCGHSAKPWNRKTFDFVRAPDKMQQRYLYFLRYLSPKHDFERMEIVKPHRWKFLQWSTNACVSGRWSHHGFYSRFHRPHFHREVAKKAGSFPCCVKGFEAPWTTWLPFYIVEWITATQQEIERDLASTHVWVSFMYFQRNNTQGTDTRSVVAKHLMLTPKVFVVSQALLVNRVIIREKKRGLEWFTLFQFDQDVEKISLYYVVALSEKPCVTRDIYKILGRRSSLLAMIQKIFLFHLSIFRSKYLVRWKHNFTERR